MSLQILPAFTRVLFQNFFFENHAWKLGVRLIDECGLYTSVYGICILGIGLEVACNRGLCKGLFCLSFGPKIAGAAYTRDYRFQGRKRACRSHKLNWKPSFLKSFFFLFLEIFSFDLNWFLNLFTFDSKLKYFCDTKNQNDIKRKIKKTYNWRSKWHIRFQETHWNNVFFC